MERMDESISELLVELVETSSSHKSSIDNDNETLSKFRFPNPEHISIFNRQHFKKVPVSTGCVLAEVFFYLMTAITHDIHSTPVFDLVVKESVVLYTTHGR